MKVGATGNFPRGKLDESDEGGLTIEMGLTPDGTFVMRFGKRWPG
jgi:hypothetical protein